MNKKTSMLFISFLACMVLSWCAVLMIWIFDVAFHNQQLANVFLVVGYGLLITTLLHLLFFMLQKT